MNAKSSTGKFLGAWLFIVRMANFLAGLGMALEGGMILLRITPMPRKAPLPISALWTHWVFPYSKKLIVCGIVAFVASLFCGLVHDRVREQGRIGPTGLSMGLLATAWAILCLQSLQTLFLR